MSAKCPECHSENPADSVFCAKCGTQLIPPKEIPDQDAQHSFTKTLLTPIEDLTQGTLFAGRYEIIEELGKGGMGKVYKALDNEIQVEVAVKLLKPEIAADEKVIARFRNELKIAREIAHKNVCKVYHFGKEEKTPYITMEFVPGEDLKGLIQKKERLTEGETISIAKQVCEGLIEAHRLGVIHRDLKPQNIMFDREGQAKIMDFGIARSVEAEGVTEAGMIIGTPDYISPEQAEGEKADHRSDIYSLGVILYEMVTGKVPFEGDTALSVALKHKSQYPLDPRKFNPDVSDDLSRLILICMEKDRERRYQSAEALLADLQNIEEGLPLGTKIQPRRATFTQNLIRKKLFIPAMVAVLAIIAVAIWQFIPQEHVVYPPKTEDSIAVISFENQTQDPTYDKYQKTIPNLLLTSIEKTDLFNVTSWERMDDLLKLMGKKGVKIIDKELGFELCRRDGVQSLVIGSFSKMGDTFVTDVKVLDVDTKRLLGSSTSRGIGEDSIMDQIDELSRDISQELGISEEVIAATQANISDITTSSMEAYNYYLKGREEFGNYLWERARDSFKKAIELDPTFATAYSYLVESYFWLQNIKETRETAEKAKACSDRATDKERLYIEAQYAGWIDGDRKKQRAILEQIVQKYPKEKRARRLLAEMSGLEEEIEKCKEILEIDPQYSWALNEIGYDYYRLKNFDKALEYAKKADALFAEYANARDTLGSIYFALGEIDKAKAKLKEAIEINSDLHWPYPTIAYICALEENYTEAIRYLDQFIEVSRSPGLKGHIHATKAFYLLWIGRMEQSLKENQKAEDLWREVENNYANYAVSFIKSRVYYERKEFDLYRKWLKIHLNNRESFIYYFSSGLTDLKEGLIDSARNNLAKMEASLAKRKPSLPYMQTWHSYLKAEILLADGLFEEVVALKDKVPSCGSPADYPPFVPLFVTNLPFEKDVFARACHKSGDLDKAIAEYERLITFDSRGEERLLIYPKYHYRLAKLYEEKGWVGKAMDQYEKFLEIWKDADKGLPEIEDAKTRHAALQN